MIKLFRMREKGPTALFRKIESCKKKILNLKTYRNGQRKGEKDKRL